MEVECQDKLAAVTTSPPLSLSCTQAAIRRTQWKEVYLKTKAHTQIVATPQKHRRCSAMINQEVLHRERTREKNQPSDIARGLVYIDNAWSNVLFCLFFFLKGEIKQENF